ncbi:CbiX/SirB N-terminal domain-containing protein [Burkholderiaceae bacterium DAT-1]|nr:CbiX/SirB N-terminal domain-containing protein [Burkholderiaceae bacterium DAT-1]
MKKGIILFAHGARDPLWALPLEALKAAVASRTDAPVELAYLELMQPTLADSVARLIGQHCSAIEIVPCFIARGAHLKRDLPAQVAELMAQHSGLSITMSDALGEVDAIQQAMADWIVSRPQTSA